MTSAHNISTDTVTALEALQCHPDAELTFARRVAIGLTNKDVATRVYLPRYAEDAYLIAIHRELDRGSAWN